MHCNAQALILALHSGISPSGSWGTLWDAGAKLWVSHVQGTFPIILFL